MSNRVRNRLTYANVVATLALVFAMSGGAYAANKFLITSSRQISPKVLKALKGAPGKAGANGANGAQGPAGAAGAQGPAGAKGEAGAAGARGEAGASGAKGEAGAPGKEGSPWTAGGTLPSGRSETGAWSLQTHGETIGITSISFPVQLESALSAAHVFFISPGEEGTVDAEQCPGSVASPEAAAGDLCVYARGLGGLTPFEAGPISDPTQEEGTPGAAKTGASLLLTPEVGSEAQTGYGTWAVTAP
jgi:Collagen triple helix repeat (20 copies)